jgi:hypothetical protein
VRQRPQGGWRVYQRGRAAALLAAAALVAMAAPATGDDAPPPAPAPVVAWAAEDSHTSISWFGADGEVILSRSDPQFLRSWLLVARCDAAGCSAPEPLRLPGEPSAGAGRRLADGSLILTSSAPFEGRMMAEPFNLFVAARAGETWGPLSPLAFPVNTPFSECCATPAPDGGFYFSSDRAGTWDVYLASPGESGSYGIHRVAALSSEPSVRGERGYFGEWPSYVDPQGAYLLLSSIRPGGLGGDDLYVACAAPGGGWLPLRNLGAPINTAGYEDGAVMAADGRTLFWSTRQGEGALSRVYSMAVGPLCPPAG